MIDHDAWIFLFGEQLGFPMLYSSACVYYSFCMKIQSCGFWTKWFLKMIAIAAVFAPMQGTAFAAPQHEAEFKKLAAQISAQRQNGEEENAKLFEYSLTLLDSMVLATLNVQGGPNLEVINTQFGLLVEHQPAAGEEYKVYRLGGTPPAFALVANFGVSGPSAVRIYSAFGAPRYRLTGRIDRSTQKDFFDDYLALVPVEGSEALFVTVTGRTDELKSGAFMAWRLSGNEVVRVWYTDILPQSSYEPAPAGIRLTYCADSAEDKPETCRRMSRERFAWDGKKWQRVEQQDLAVKTPKK